MLCSFCEHFYPRPLIHEFNLKAVQFVQSTSLSRLQVYRRSGFHTAAHRPDVLQTLRHRPPRVSIPDHRLPGPPTATGPDQSIVGVASQHHQVLLVTLDRHCVSADDVIGDPNCRRGGGRTWSPSGNGLGGRGRRCWRAGMRRGEQVSERGVGGVMDSLTSRSLS